MTPSRGRVTLLAVLVSRIGLTALKGARHQSLPEVELTASGPIGDRVFCLVDPSGEDVDAADHAARVLRTVENPAMPALRVAWDGTTLRVTFPDDTVVAGDPTDSGERLRSDYWGRGTLLAVQDGPHATAIGEWLGRRVVLARAGAGEVVYGGHVTVVTTGDLRELATRTGDPTLAGQDARFRSTLTLDTPRSASTFVPGELVRVGEVLLEVRGAVPRCAVVDLDPARGGRLASGRALTALPVVAGEPTFGFDAQVVTPGTVRLADPASLERAA